MRKFTTEHTVFSLKELSEEAKQKVFDYFRESEQFEYLGDDLQYKLEELLKENKMTCDDPKIYYSLGCSQGDGAMFEGTVTWRAWTVGIRQNGHYNHYNSKTFWNFESTKTGKEPSDATWNKFNEVYVSICKGLEAYGYDVMESANSEEMLTEMIEANDYEFYEDGRIA